MEMTNSDIEEGVRRCLNNAKSLLKDARLLLKNGSAGHALFFIISAIEETSKSFIYAGRRIGSWRHGETEKDVTNHASKLSFFIFHLIARTMEDVFEKRRKRIFHPEQPDKPLNVDNFVEMAQNLNIVRGELWKSRLVALYVDRENGKWISPSEIEKSEVETWLRLAERYLHDIEFQTRNILKAPKDLAVQYHNWLQHVLVPFAKNYLLDHIDELYADKVISQKLYEKLKKERQQKAKTEADQKTC